MCHICVRFHQGRIEGQGIGQCMDIGTGKSSESQRADTIPGHGIPVQHRDGRLSFHNVCIINQWLLQPTIE